MPGKISETINGRNSKKKGKVVPSLDLESLNKFMGESYFRNKTFFKEFLKAFLKEYL